MFSRGFAIDERSQLGHNPPRHRPKSDKNKDRSQPSGTVDVTHRVGPWTDGKTRVVSQNATPQGLMDEQAKLAEARARKAELDRRQEEKAAAKEQADAAKSSSKK